MKKIITLLIICLFLFCGCTSTLNKYKINEDDKYLMKDNASGGNKMDDILTIDKIWTTRWLGSEKLVFDFSNGEQKSTMIPYYTIKFNEDKTNFVLTIFHTVEGDISLPQTSECKYISQMSAAKGDDCIIYDINILPDMKVAVDEINPSGQLVVNIKKIEDNIRYLLQKKTPLTY